MLRRGCLAPGPGLLGVLEVLLESLQEELLVFGVRVARVVDVVVRGVDPGRRELHPVLKRDHYQMEVAVLLFKYGRSQTWQYCILETDASVQV